MNVWEVGYLSIEADFLSFIARLVRHTESDYIEIIACHLE